MKELFQVLEIIEEANNDYIPKIYIIYSSLNREKAIGFFNECLRYESEYNEWIENMQNAYVNWHNKEFGEEEKNEPLSFPSYMRWFKKATEDNHNQRHIDFVNDYEKTNPFITTATKYSRDTSFMYIENELDED